MTPFDGRSSGTWVTPAYGPGWADWSDADNELVRCRKNGTEVRGVGMCRRTSGAGSLAWTLPVGMWPTRITWRNCSIQGVPAVCFITDSGAVTMYTAVTNGQFVCFDFTFDLGQP